MATSQNGWSASPSLTLRPLVIAGVSFLPGIRDDDDVATVLGYVLTQFHERVEPLRNPGCWGFSYRANRNNPNALSNHSSGTAVDANAPAHPNGVPTRNTFTSEQALEVHQILAEVDHAVRWGGDYSGTPDAMHFEIDADVATLHQVAEGLRDDMPRYRDWDSEDRKALANDVAAAILDDAKVDDEKTISVRQALNKIRNAVKR